MSRGTNTDKERQDGVELLSVKELCLEVQGRAFLARTGYTPLFEETEELPYFEEIRESWQIAIREINVGTPKGLKADSIEEQIQIESFFIEFRLGDPAQAIKKYSRLIQKHSEDQVFLNAVAD
jgi:hypothetical protein